MTTFEAAGRVGLVAGALVWIVPGSRVAGPARTAVCGANDNLEAPRVLESVQPGDVVGGARRRASGPPCGDLRRRRDACRHCGPGRGRTRGARPPDMGSTPNAWPAHARLSSLVCAVNDLPRLAGKPKRG